VVGFVVLLQLGCYAALPFLPELGLGGFAAVFLLVIACVLLVAWALPPLARESRVAILLALVVALVVGAAPVALGDRLGGPLGAALVALGLLGGGSLLGRAVGSRVTHTGHLLVVAYVSSLADVFSVFSDKGVTAQVVESERMLSLLAVSWALPGWAEMTPVLGVGDIVMVTLYTVATRRLDLEVGRTLLALAAGFALVLGALLVAQIPLPALPFLGAAMLAAHPQAFRLRTEDRRPALIGMALITAVFAVLF